jgi:hypothetical protein
VNIDDITVSGYQHPIAVNKLAKFTISNISNNLNVTIKGGGRVCVVFCVALTILCSLSFKIFTGFGSNLIVFFKLCHLHNNLTGPSGDIVPVKYYHQKDGNTRVEYMPREIGLFCKTRWKLFS